MVKLVRYSGRPVKQESIDKFMNEWRVYYDAVLNKYKMDMLKVQEVLEKIDARLKRKYDDKVEINLPQNEQEMSELIYKYEAPIMFAPGEKNPQEVWAVILDIPLNYIVGQ